MDKNKLINEIKKLISDKKTSNILVVLLILLFLLIAYNYFVPSTKEKGSNDEVTITEDTQNVSKNLEYEEKEKRELVSILEQIDGVGKVEVKINFESNEVKVPAYESTTQTSTTQENDNSGGVRKNEQTNETTTVVKSEDEPYILQTYKPNVIGVVVVAEGASDINIKNNIQKAVCSLYNLPVNKVNVYTKK